MINASHWQIGYSKTNEYQVQVIDNSDLISECCLRGHVDLPCTCMMRALVQEVSGRIEEDFVTAQDLSGELR